MTVVTNRTTAKKTPAPALLRFEIDGRLYTLEWAEVAMVTAGIMKELPGSAETADLKKFNYLAEILFEVETHLRVVMPDHSRLITPDIANAVDVCRVIKEILSRGYVTAFDRETLPIQIAAIARTSRSVGKLASKPGESRPTVVDADRKLSHL